MLASASTMQASSSRKRPAPSEQKQVKKQKRCDDDDDAQGQKIDLFDLPNAVLLRIFDSGTRLQAAEMVCKKWKSNIRSVPDFWEKACRRLCIDEVEVTGNMNEVLNVDAELISMITTSPSEIWRKIWLKHKDGVCVHCLQCKDCDYKLMKMKLCWDCRFLEPYNAVTQSNARKYFKLQSKKMSEAIRENNIQLKRLTYERDTPRHHYYTSYVTLFSFQQLLEVAGLAFGEKKAKTMANKLRRLLKIKKMKGEFIKEV